MAPPPKQIIPDPFPITIKSGSETETIISKSGDSTKPVSVYAKGRSDNPLLSSVGLKINIADFTLDISLGLDNIGISGVIKNENTTNAFGLVANVSQLKLGFENSTTVKWDENTNNTSFSNASINGWALVAVCVFVQTGQCMPSPQHAY